MTQRRNTQGRTPGGRAPDRTPAKGVRLRRKRRGRGGRLAGFLVIVVMALYIPAMWKWFFTPGVETGIIQEDTLEVKIAMTGVFVRQETLLRAPDTGSILPVARYGERVPSNGTVASFLSNGSEDAYRQYRNAETDILRRVAKAAAENGAAAGHAFGTLTTQETAALALAANKGDMVAASSLRATIDRRLNEQIRSLAQGSSTAGYLEEEKQELQRLETRMNKSVITIRAAEPGIVCYRFDGYETVLSPAGIPNLTLGAISMMPVEKVVETGWMTPEEIAVKLDEPYAKIVQNEASWLVFEVDGQTGKTILSRLESARLEDHTYAMEAEVEGVDGRLALQLQSVTLPQEPETRALVVGKLTRRVEQTMELRRVTGALVLQSLKGMKVPRKALLNINEVDGTADIMLARMNRASLRRVQVRGIQDSWAVIGNLEKSSATDRVSVYDLYLQNPDGIQDGQMLQK